MEIVSTLTRWLERRQGGSGREKPAAPPASLSVFAAGRASGGRIAARGFDGGTTGDYPPGGLDTFIRMQRDAQVRACLMTKKLAVLSEQAEVHPAQPETELAVRVARKVRQQLARVPGGISGLVWGALDALAMGFALGEPVWSEEGNLAGVRWHDPRRFLFIPGENGDVAKVEFRDTGQQVERERFVLYTYQSRYGSPYGESDLLAAYRAWASKDQLRRMWLSALDRFGAPIPVARVPRQWNDSEIAHLSGLLANIQNESHLVVPEDVEVTLALDTGRVEPARAFATAIAYEDTQIARAILGQELTTQAGGSSGRGSYALGRVHQAVCDSWIQALRAQIAEHLLTDQIARRIVLMHYGPDTAQTACPLIAFPNLSEAELSTRRELVHDLLQGNVLAPDEPWLRRWLGVPEQSQ